MLLDISHTELIHTHKKAKVANIRIRTDYRKKLDGEFYVRTDKV